VGEIESRFSTTE